MKLSRMVFCLWNLKWVFYKHCIFIRDSNCKFQVKFSGFV